MRSKKLTALSFILAMLSPLMLAASDAAAQRANPLDALRDLFPSRSFRVQSGSMLPTMKPGVYLRVDQTAAAKARIRRGDAIVFTARDGSYYIKRVIGLPGEVIAFKAGAPIINGAPLRQRLIGPYREDTGRGAHGLGAALLKEEIAKDGRSWRIIDHEKPARMDEMAPVRIPEGAFFVVGDNRDNSVDSRMQTWFGFVWSSKVIGLVKDVKPPRKTD
ncbi:MAG: signal peptidase I [Neomegalonema sp.]|nr:signal peptidase I [Neomegalonema sp.]